MKGDGFLKFGWLPFLAVLGMTICFGTVRALEGAVTPNRLRCEYKTNPLGIDAARPRLSWQLDSPDRGVFQTAYQIQAASSSEDLAAEENLLWDTGQRSGDRSIHVPYEGPALHSAQRVYWRVRVWNQVKQASEWSESAWFEMGLLDPENWTADWIQPGLPEDISQSGPAPFLRWEFELEGEIASARLYVTCLGLYEMHLNGRKVGDQVFTPGWTAYDERLQYQTYDISNLLHPGLNAIGAILGDGWYRGYLAWQDNRNVYGDKLGLLAQLVVTLANGEEIILGTNPTWKAATGPILRSDIYNGETYDARLELTGWDRPEFDDEKWQRVKPLDHSKSILVAPVGPPVHRIQQIRPVQILTTPAGETVLDMGQNMVGRVRLRVAGPAGTTVTLRHAEVLDREGNFYAENLRAAKATVRYTLKGGETEIYEPHFTFQGFRYVAVNGYPGELTQDSLTGIVIHSDMTPTGTFACSNEMLNQLQHNIVWGQKGNFLDVPTDCPQRDERLGWTGDAQVFAPTACFNMDAASFFTKWLGDLAADQQADGAVPYVIPNVLSHGQATGASASAGWGDAAVIIPRVIYTVYGDQRILKNQYDSMKAWVEYMRRQAGDNYLWTTGFHFGDWLAYNTTQSDYPGATTDKDLIATAFFAYSTSLLQATAHDLGYREDAREYDALFQAIRRAFLQEYVTPNGRLASNTQTAYSLALAFDLLPDDLAERAAERLARDVRRFQHITTGFLGTPLICHVLSRYGYLDEVYMLINRKEYPSWLYPITRGATTIWERWDGIKPDGTFQDKGMNSFNHYAYGAIGDWLYKNTAGIQPDPDDPGYHHTIIRPRPGGGITWAKARLLTMYGTLESKWSRTDKSFELNLTIPPNSHATVVLPDTRIASVREDGRKLEIIASITHIHQAGDDVIVEVGSGTYAFTCRR